MKSKTRLADVWNKLTAPQSSIEEDARREYMTRVILLIMAGIAVFFIFPIGLGFIAGMFDLPSMLMQLGVVGAMLAGLLVTLRGGWRISRLIPIITFFALGMYGSSYSGILTTFVLAYCISVILSAMLMEVWFTWVMVSVVVMTHLVLSQIFFPQILEDFLTSAIPYTALIVGLASLFQFAMRRLQAALTSTRSFASQLQSEIQVRETAEAELLKKNQELALLNRVIAAAASSLDVEDILDTTLCELVKSLSLMYGSAALVQDDRSHLKVVAEYPKMDGGSGSPILLVPTDGNASTQFVLENRLPLAIVDARQDERTALVHNQLKARGVASVLLVPLIVHDRLLGSIELDSQATHEFTDEEIQMATHAALAAAQSIENAQLYAKVQRLAIHDDLTEILNRRGFLDYGAREFELSRRFERDLALIFLDVDHLKDINDNYGHTWGDVFLRSLGKLIAGSVREIDLAGRYGGDEFVILLTETSLPQAVEAAERLRERIQQASITIRSVEFQVSASLGVAYRTSQIASLSELIDSADTALYQAKAAGRNCVRVAPPG